MYAPIVISFISLICLRYRLSAAALNGININSKEGKIRELLVTYTFELPSKFKVPIISTTTPKKEITSVEISIGVSLTLKSIYENKAINSGEMF